MAAGELHTLVETEEAQPLFGALRRETDCVLVGGGVKNVIEGPGLSPPVPLELIRVLESDGYLFLRYLVA